jgi:soluble lytic murein transglycosylase-like protein
VVTAHAVRLGALLAPLALLVLQGCGGTSSVTRTERAFVAGAIHDPVRDWADARPQEPTLPPRRRGPRLIRKPGAVIYRMSYAPSGEVRAFGRSDLQRISIVQPVVRQAARTHGVPTEMINGIIWVESRFHQRARSRVGALSLMQVMPRTGRELAQQLGRSYAPFDPSFNIHAGTYYFARLLERYRGNTRLALAAYNIGPGTVDGWLQSNRPLAERSERYVENVFSAARAFRARGY